MDEIPKPELLNPDRENRDDREDFTAEDHRSQAQLLAKALGESCAYADQLWEQVNALRGYLLDSLPRDPRTPGPHTAVGASPTGPDDEEGWARWIDAFATTTSVLCGSHGDSGFGLSRAREEARLRRTAPAILLHARHPDLGRLAPDSVSDGTTSDAPQSASPRHSDERQSNPPREQTAQGAKSVGKSVATAVVTLLALRGLRPRPKARVVTAKDE